MWNIVQCNGFHYIGAALKNHSPDIWHFWKWLQWNFTCIKSHRTFFPTLRGKKWNFSSYNLGTKYARNLSYVSETWKILGIWLVTDWRTGAQTSSCTSAGNSSFWHAPWPLKVNICWWNIRYPHLLLERLVRPNMGVKLGKRDKLEQFCFKTGLRFWAAILLKATSPLPHLLWGEQDLWQRTNLFKLFHRT